ncbi:MAG: hypothetical protein WDM94_05395 [Bauldia sp.]
MTLRTIVGATALTLVLSTAAFAAQPVMHPMMKHKIVAATDCSILAHQFSKAPKHKSMWLAKAEKLDVRGAKLCSTGSPVRGAFDLRAALHLIGVAPKV